MSCPLFQKCGTKNRIRYIDINKLRHGLGDGVCYYLIGMHAYIVRAFAGRWKRGALKLIRAEHCQERFRELGQSLEQLSDLFKKLQASTCKLYISSTGTVDINIARHQISAHGVWSSCLLSFHQARTVSSCKQCTLTNRLTVSNNIRKSQAQSSMAGSEMTMASSRLNGCGDLKLPKQCCSCCRASATVDATSRHGSA